MRGRETRNLSDKCASVPRTGGDTLAAGLGFVLVCPPVKRSARALTSTKQVVNALEKADKDFDFVIVTGSNHGAAEGAYGSRRRADFPVRHLLGVEPRER